MKVVGFSKYSPLDVYNLIPDNYTVTIDEKGDEDILMCEEYKNKYKNKIVLVFNTEEYLTSNNIKIVDADDNELKFKNILECK